MNEDTKQLFLSTLAPDVETKADLNPVKPWSTPNQGNIYRGFRDERGPVVYLNGWPLINRSDEIADDNRVLGFDWGHCGQRCAELAYTILTNEYGRLYANAQYQNFKRDVIALLPENEWALTSNQIAFFTTKDSNVN
jgi:hypothetical protein